MACPERDTIKIIVSMPVELILSGPIFFLKTEYEWNVVDLGGQLWLDCSGVIAIEGGLIMSVIYSSQSPTCDCAF